MLLILGLRPRGHLGARAPRRRRPGDAAQGSRRAGAPTTCSPRASGPASTARSRSSSTSRATSRRRRGSSTASRGRRTSRRCGKPQFNDEKTVAIVFVTPSSAPQDEATDNLVDRLRGEIVPAATAGGPAVAYVSGQTAAFKDIADQIISKMPMFLLYIIGVTLPAPDDGVQVDRGLALTAAVTTHPLGVHRLRRARPRRPGGPPARPDGPRQDRADRDVRAADRVRDPVRALDGLHGLPHEPHPGGARPRPRDARRRSSTGSPRSAASSSPRR